MGNATSRAAVAATPDQESPKDTASTTIYASGGFGNNRLATGFRTAALPAAPDESQPIISKSDNSLKPTLSSGDSIDDAIEISDDEQESDDGGMVINIDTVQNHQLSDDMVLDDDQMDVEKTEKEEEEVEEEDEDSDDEEEGETHSHSEEDTEPQSSTRETTLPLSSTERDAHDQLQGDIERFSRTVMGGLPSHSVASNVRVQPGPRLADLSPEELELQLKYAFFHVSRSKIDLNQPAVCLSCLQSGHAERDCPELTCVHCSASHSSRLCPLLQRCSKCRDRGHTAESCPTGLKITTIPCDICGTFNHTEQTCPQRFLPSYGMSDVGPTKHWISCCVCASKSHLVGDCPNANQVAAARWSLKSFPSEQVINLSLESNSKQREIESANRGLRPEGLKIRGRAGLHSARGPSGRPEVDTSDSDEQFLKPRVQGPRNAKRGNLTFTTQMSKESMTAGAIPKKSVLTEFLKAINQQRQAGRGRFEVVYANK
ncbi:hypothetical protein AYL99_03093 [Fonsecaea erecta]|uniref:CCHC-type domain-containing protein n=1 Tax=Fonsecaea erecta TaxID=1367422 RepID=A0A178ZWT7_9EURO|nr:hypothetical protein AYL99_03093 [Fonsecaea erecta]OAP63866.1 hypothetical protein AYL99_03093 [Fonsecaea erecta]